MKNAFLKFGAAVGSLPTLLLPSIVFAKPVGGGLEASQSRLVEIGAETGIGAKGQDLPELIGNLISIILGVVGIVLVIYIVQAGVMYMTAGGDDKKVGEAKTMIKNAVIGIVLIVAAYSISSFVINAISQATA